MKQTSESLSLEATRYLKVAEGYCVSARAGGEQSEAKDQRQTKVNPIRPCSMTSRRTGGICAGAAAPAGVPGEVRGASPAVSHEITRSAWTDGCCGVCGVGMVRMFHKSNQDRWQLRRGAVRRKEALNTVTARKGKPGVDGQTAQAVRERWEEEAALMERLLREGRYEPKPVRRVWIEKPGSRDKRPLGIPTIRDRIVQTALLYVMEPIFEYSFHEHSYGLPACH